LGKECEPIVAGDADPARDAVRLTPL